MVRTEECHLGYYGWRYQAPPILQSLLEATVGAWVTIFLTVHCNHNKK